MTIDCIRAIYGPLNNSICLFNVFIKNVGPINACMITLTMTLTKFVFVFIYKSIPVMEDDFLSTFIYMNINMISILATLSRMYLPGRPIFNQVNTQHLKNCVLNVLLNRKFLEAGDLNYQVLINSLFSRLSVQGIITKDGLKKKNQ